MNRWRCRTSAGLDHIHATPLDLDRSKQNHVLISVDGSEDCASGEKTYLYCLGGIDVGAGAQILHRYRNNQDSYAEPKLTKASN